MEIINSTFANVYLESNLVYPLEKGYFYIAKLDKEWVENKVKTQFKVIRIGNKYCVKILVNNGGSILVTNHDGTYWLTSKKESNGK